MHRRNFLLLAGGAALGPLAATAPADVLDDNDLAYLRLLTVCELLGIDFYSRALRSKRFHTDKAVAGAGANERQHYQLIAGLVAAAGQTAATPDDVDFAYPRNAFDSAGGVARLAVALEATFLGAYLGAVDGVDAPSLKQPLARVAASQAGHLALFRHLLGRRPFADGLPGGLSIDRASNALDAYTA